MPTGMLACTQEWKKQHLQNLRHLRRIRKRLPFIKGTRYNLFFQDDVYAAEHAGLDGPVGIVEQHFDRKTAVILAA